MSNETSTDANAGKAVITFRGAMEQALDNQVAFRDHRGHRIEFVPRLMLFQVSGPEFAQFKDEYCRFGSVDDAKIKIDQLITDAEKFRAQNAKIDVTLLDNDGNEIKVTGINRTTGAIIGAPSYGRYVYPNLPWVKDAIKRREALTAELIPINSRLEAIQTPVQRTHGRIGVEDYPHRMMRLQDAIDTNVKKATEMAKLLKEEE